MRRTVFVLLLITVCIFTACQPDAPTQTPSRAIPTAAPSETAEPTVSFPAGVNPLTGKPVADSSLLKTPALLISISHFPATARPQAGLSFAPFVYEFYITEGATRFLAVFYGEFPAPEIPITAGCETRQEPFVQTQMILGNRVWLDSNGNGTQDVDENGISGMCVNLYDAQANLIQRTSTDSNGYYGFNVQPGTYYVEFVRPAGLDFTVQNVGDDTQDSDADPSTGRATVTVSSDDLSVDAGLIPSPNVPPTPDASANLPLAQVGPIRSGRLMYSYIADYFQNSCLIFAFASPEVLERLPQCHMVFHELTGGGYMMDLSEMRSVANDNKKAKGSDFNYASNLFADQPPADGKPASQLHVYFAYQNQSGWVYDPLYQAYLRYVDTSDYDQAGILHPDVDRLTGRQLHFENIIVLAARHEVLSPTNLDIHLGAGKSGPAWLFRDGQMFKMAWNTGTGEEKDTSQPHPIKFTTPDGGSLPLKPGHTWIIVVTPDSKLDETSPGQWLLNFTQPPGAK